MVKALFEGKVIGESENTIIIEGNHYFPPADVKKEIFKDSDHQTTCPWKGQAHYYHIQGEDLKENAAWYYPEPKEAAKEIAGYIAFDKRYVEVKE